MRIAIISDIHGNLPALEAVVKDIGRRGADAIVNLGDSLSGPLLPLETAQYLMAQDWLHLAGNHERQLLTEVFGKRGPSDEFAFSQLTAKELAWLSSLRPACRYSPEILLCHGTPSSDSDYLLETVEPDRVRLATLSELDERLGHADAELIACGHTHLPRTVRASTGQLVVNPGSIGLPAYDATRPYPHLMETGAPDARYALVERLAGSWICSLISVPYPFRAMAKLALERQRTDWGCALLSGFMG
jgi:predicted phosphodiesterase